MNRNSGANLKNFTQTSKLFAKIFSLEPVYYAEEEHHSGLIVSDAKRKRAVNIDFHGVWILVGAVRCYPEV